MTNKSQRIYAILGIAVGAGLAAYSFRKGMQLYQQRQVSQRLDKQLPESSEADRRRYQAASQPDRAPIPATGAVPAAPAMTDMVTTQQPTASPRSGIDMDELVAPLIEHAIAFNTMQNLLRSRQVGGEGNEGTESLTVGDRTSIRNVVEQMQAYDITYDEAAMRKNPLALRIHKLTSKLHNALDDQSLTGSDLFRVYGEVRTELCSLTRELENSGQVTITGLDHIRQLYECQ